MHSYDILMLAVLVAATIFGAWKGLAWQVASLAAIFASYFIALKFSHPVSQLIGASPPWDRFLAMLIIYLLSSLAIWMMFRMVATVIDRVKLKEFDRQIGALLGFAKGVLLCVIITLFAVTLLGDEKAKAICQTRSGYYIARLLEEAHAVMPAEVHDVVHPYLHSLDEELHQHHAPESPFDPLAIPSDGHASRTLDEFKRDAHDAMGKVDESLGKLRRSADALDELRDSVDSLRR